MRLVYECVFPFILLNLIINVVLWYEMCLPCFEMNIRSIIPFKQVSTLARTVLDISNIKFDFCTFLNHKMESMNAENY